MSEEEANLAAARDLQGVNPFRPLSSLPIFHM